MKKFFLWFLLVAGALVAAYFLAPERIRNQMTATAGFFGSSFGRTFSIAADKIGGAKDFAVEKANQAKGKAVAVVNPKSPAERRAEILENLEATIAEIENPQTSAGEKQKLAGKAQKLVDEVKKQNKNEPGLLTTIVGKIAGSGSQCENP